VLAKNCFTYSSAHIISCAFTPIARPQAVHQIGTEYAPGRINGQSTISTPDRYRDILFTISEKKRGQ